MTRTLLIIEITDGRDGELLGYGTAKEYIYADGSPTQWTVNPGIHGTRSQAYNAIEETPA